MPEPPDGFSWSVYIVRCRDGSLYTGIATDVSRRIEEHRTGRIGSRYLRGRAPLELAAKWPIGDRSLASRVEHRIKRMSRGEKESLLAAPAGITAVLSRLERHPDRDPAPAE
jgi:putative endonuclease